MNHSVENNTLTIVLDKRIDTTNADQFEQELFEIVASAPGNAIVLDARNLEYISSAGLRVLLKLKKQSAGSLPIMHVSPVVNEIFKATGFYNILDVHPEEPDTNIEGWSSGNSKIEIVQDE